jgi:hypothetical protein
MSIICTCGVPGALFCNGRNGCHFNAVTGEQAKQTAEKPMSSNTQLPAEVVLQIQKEAEAYANKTFAGRTFSTPHAIRYHQYIEIATEYATKLLHAQQATEEKIDKALHAERNKMQKRLTESEIEWAGKLHQAHALLTKVAAVAEPVSKKLYNEIKTFLDGKV